MNLLKAKTKLKSQSGVSILYGLLAFMVAAMVSATILAAAMSSLKRVYSNRQAEQNRLTLVSAAQLVRDEMAKTTLTETKTTTVTVNDDDSKIDIKNEKNDTGTFATEMRNAVDAVKTYGGDYSSKGVQDFLISSSAASSDYSMDDVEVSFVVSTSKVVFTFTLAGRDEKIFLTMAEKSTQTQNISTTGNTTVTTDTTTITWNKDNAVIKGISENDEENNG